MRKIAILVLTAVLALNFTACKKENKDESSNNLLTQISGREWLEQRSETNEGYSNIVDTTEEIYSLYIAGKMTADDFKTELEITQSQLFKYQKDYEDEKSKVTIDFSGNEVAQKGTDALELLFSDTNDLYVASVDQSGTPLNALELSYVYLNYKDKIIDDYVKYKAAIGVLNEYNDDGEAKKE